MKASRFKNRCVIDFFSSIQFFRLFCSNSDKLELFDNSSLFASFFDFDFKISVIIEVYICFIGENLQGIESAVGVRILQYLIGDLDLKAPALLPCVNQNSLFERNVSFSVSASR